MEKTENDSNIITNRTSSDILTCSICLESVRKQRASTHQKCAAAFCESCLGAYIRLEITQGKWKVECANCSSLLAKEIIHKFLEEHPLLQEHFTRLVADANQDPLVKTCPNCGGRKRVKNHKTKRVACEECHFDWCFTCHAPWHKSMSCKDFKRGNKMFKKWTKDTTECGTGINARPCPKCKVFIQRQDGCDQMTCPRCRTTFCYLCGKKIVHSKLFGSHWSIYSVLGCRFIYKPHHPVQRKVIRGFLLAVVLASLPVFATIFVALSPVYGVYRLHKCTRKQ